MFLVRGGGVVPRFSECLQTITTATRFQVGWWSQRRGPPLPPLSVDAAVLAPRFFLQLILRRVLKAICPFCVTFCNIRVHCL